LFATVRSEVCWASSRKVTSSIQYIDSIDQCPRTDPAKASEVTQLCEPSVMRVKVVFELKCKCRAQHSGNTRVVDIPFLF
jgi:hypothetical protein